MKRGFPARERERLTVHLRAKCLAALGCATKRSAEQPFTLSLPPNSSDWGVIDTLTIGIGNAHGYYRGEPDIKLEVLRETRRFTDIPFVLHGCTGMSEDIIKDAIRLGVAKINFGTEIRYKYVQHYQEALETLDHQGHSWKLSQFASNALAEDVKQIIHLSGSAGKA